VARSRSGNSAVLREPDGQEGAARMVTHIAGRWAVGGRVMSRKRIDEHAKSEDDVVIAGLLRHDEEALLSLIDSCGKHVYGRALQIVLEPSLAEEVAQDTLLVLWWDPERFDASKGNIRSYLMRIARSKAIDVVRKEERIRTKEALLQGAGGFFETTSVEGDVEGAIVVRAALAKLPLKKREVLFLAFYRGLTYRQVAEVLNLPEGTVKTRIRQSLLGLRKTIANPETP
jgi:RNA polymerase sigma-70 factor, ECF subfamily